jgi:hypothetical protein
MNDWSFSNLKRSDTLWGTHGYHRYPAKFIPQLVRRIIETYSSKNDLVGDPFVGSATTGVEALRTGRRFWGSDVNPGALIISEAKCAALPPQKLEKTWKLLGKQIEKLPYIGRRFLTEIERKVINEIDIHHATGLERLAYWFPAPHTAVLDGLLQEILNLPGKPVRTFFLCAFSNILKRSSIWLSGSTKAQKDLGKNLSDPKEAFQWQVKDMIRRNSLYWDELSISGISPASLHERYKLVLKDARHLPLEDGSLDLLASSPPYATCYEYSEIHQLTQLWFERYKLIPDQQWRHICIGSKHVSARQKDIKQENSSTGSSTADKALSKLESLKIPDNSNKAEAAALRYYFQDMQLVLKEFARIVRPGKRMVLVVGNSRRRSVDIPTSTAMCEMARIAGFDLQRRIVRKIPARVLVMNRNEKTGRFSSTSQTDTQAYPEEDILVFKRQI